MLRYEMLMLAVPEITNDESKAIESQIESIIDQEKGSIISYDRWGKYKLAYPVKKNDYGIYYLVRFQVAKDNLHSLLQNLNDYFAVKQTELIMRHLTTKLSSGQSLEYKKPESLEDIPVQNITNFIKDNKLTGLLNSDVLTKDSELTESIDENIEET